MASSFPRSRPFLAALVAISLIDSSHAAPQTNAVIRKSIASAKTEFVHDGVQIELPRIMTWRPLPVATPAPRRRPRPRAVPTPPSPTANRATKATKSSCRVRSAAISKTVGKSKHRFADPRFIHLFRKRYRGIAAWREFGETARNRSYSRRKLGRDNGERYVALGRPIE